MLFGIVLLMIMTMLDWTQTMSGVLDESKILRRIIMTMIGILLMHGSFWLALLLGIIWGVVGDIVFCIIGELNKINQPHVGDSPQTRHQTGEYLMDGQGKLTGTLFNPAEHTGYSEVQRDLNGRVLVDSNGRIICTRYVK